MPEQDNSNDVVDIQELKEIMDDDMELIHECFVDFIQDWPEVLAEIESAVSEKNAEKLNAAAHKLKGTLRYLAADPAATAAYSLESAGKENDLKGVEDMLSNLKNECQKLIAFIDSFHP